MEEMLVTVAETKLFERKAAQVWSDTERLAFIDFIARNPEAGDVIEGTGGVRKVRWTRKGAGKRGGVRVIYFYFDHRAPLYLLTMYSKTSQEDMTPDEKRAIAKAAEAIKQLIKAMT